MLSSLQRAKEGVDKQPEEERESWVRRGACAKVNGRSRKPTSPLLYTHKRGMRSLALKEKKTPTAS
jgi:hypothetical protein